MADSGRGVGAAAGMLGAGTAALQGQPGAAATGALSTAAAPVGTAASSSSGGGGGLSAADVAAYQAPEFTLGRIPEIEPPASLVT
jgi:hypothetical protein